MDLQNMRSLGVVRVDAFCACGWQASVDVSPLPDELAVPDVRLRLKCCKCGNWPTETSRSPHSPYREHVPT
jgi:hypothetical protein